VNNFSKKEGSLGYLPMLFLRIPTIGFEYDSDFSHQEMQEGGGQESFGGQKF